MPEVIRPSPVVAIFNSADDVIEMLARALEDHGFQTVLGRIAEIQSGVLDLVAFLDEHNPDVVLFDLPRPYEEHLNFLRLLGTTDGLKRRGWILATTNDEALKIVFPPVDVQLSIIGKPDLFELVVQAVRQALENAAVRRVP